ncbi:hypothetical protein EDC01DRAFT_632357 [Geopyxis carbonaria]|nr:hypothetical protein EDC01DRAFT_632357 [Geopyxis carbonaria]
MQISTVLLAALTLATAGFVTAEAAPAPEPEPWRRTYSSRNGGGRARVQMSGGSGSMQSFFSKPRPYAINDLPGSVQHHFGTQTFAAENGPRGKLEGIEKAITGVCGRLIGRGAAERDFAAGSTIQRPWMMPSGQTMYAKLELLDAKTVSKESCEEEMNNMVKYYGRPTEQGTYCNNAWSYTHDGHVKHSLVWGAEIPNYVF